MTVLIILHVLVCSFLVFVILLQPGKSDGAGIGFGSSSQSIFGSKGAGNFLTKTTSACAVLFLVTSFFLTRSRVKDNTGMDVREVPGHAAPVVPGPGPGKAEPPAAPAPAAPTKK